MSTLCFTESVAGSIAMSLLRSASTTYNTSPLESASIACNRLPSEPPADSVRVTVSVAVSITEIVPLFWFGT